ncbi:anti-sigma-D factor RsdA [Nocardia transvalensis]|uniref:anti-sigma-D factor RsdA n=1 Tax=Nocardia transvalensis TaxID=37333 RepID=UPI00189310BE|nr:anti-sigma-D factor RsdA [Nocardia transvalensis]MBF6327423.1 hypothetical protein [Nocardia transvalensis]
MARDGERGRGDWKARLGSQNSDPYAEASGDTGPVDIAAVRRDDALIDAIAGDGPVATDSAEEYQLASLLANWRGEIVEAPMPAGPDLDTIVAAVNQEIGARKSRINVAHRRHLRLVRPLMGAAAALALIMGGMTAFSYSAQPGDPLWRVKEVVFSQQAQSTITQRAEDSLAEAQGYIAAGQPSKAKQALESAQANATQVNDVKHKSNLESRVEALLAQLPPEVKGTVAPTSPSGTSQPGKNPTTTGNETAGSGSKEPDISILQSPNEPTTDGSGTTGHVPPTPTQPPTVPPTTAEPPTGAPTQPPTQDPTVPTTVASPGGGAGPGVTAPVVPTSAPGAVRPTAPIVPTTFIVPGGSLPGGVS